MEPRQIKMGGFKKFAIVLFLIGATLAQERDSSTKICNNEEGKVFFGKINACTTLAEQDFYLSFLNNDIYKAACDFLSAKVILQLISFNNVEMSFC